jgi:hypothetical protein
VGSLIWRRQMDTHLAELDCLTLRDFKSRV